MKRYLLFCGDKYYPKGGWYDLQASYDTLEEAVLAVLPQPLQLEAGTWAHVVDSESGDIVASYRSGGIHAVGVWV